MKLKKTRQVMYGLLGAAALFLVLGAILSFASLTASLLFVLAGTVLFFAFMAYNFANWRCPHCGEYLGWNLGKGIPFCPHCVKRLDL